ncbi:hypothetical protein [Psychromonas algarum]|uniref:hypothetical protein n=1 Tax=Psychromonas algarum TaxID=2555643 RepID=UPI001419FBFF|nr:hypothetical protein [Psychromonas sp. RZ22]
MSNKKKPTEEELQQWLAKVHLGSCCSDPIADDDQQPCLKKDKKITVDTDKAQSSK